MILALAMLLALGVAAVSDRLACAWQDAREAGDVWRGVPIAMLHEAVTWVPVYAAIELRTPLLAVATVAGAGLGTWRGFARRRRATCTCCPLHGSCHT